MLGLRKKHQMELTINVPGAFHFKAKGSEETVIGTLNGFLEYLEDDSPAKPAEKYPVGFTSSRKAELEELEADTELEPAAELDEEDEDDEG